MKEKRKPRKGWKRILIADIKKNGPIERLLPDVFEDEDIDKQLNQFK